MAQLYVLRICKRYEYIYYKGSVRNIFDCEAFNLQDGEIHGYVMSYELRCINGQHYSTTLRTSAAKHKRTHMQRYQRLTMSAQTTP